MVTSSPTRKLARLDENDGAADITLSADDLREIDSAAAKVQQPRYPEEMEQLTGR
jgi:aryl-alcohol dehydrogenase-like predicted oxidoreductase